MQGRKTRAGFAKRLDTTIQIRWGDFPQQQAGAAQSTQSTTEPRSGEDLKPRRRTGGGTGDMLMLYGLLALTRRAASTRGDNKQTADEGEKIIVFVPSKYCRCAREPHSAMFALRFN